MIRLKKKIAVLFLLSVCLFFVAEAPMVSAALMFNGTNISGDANSFVDATGTISIGASSATGVTIGRAGVTATFPGTVTIAGTTTTLQNLVVSGTCTGSGCFTAGGDLSGTSASQTVTGIRGRAVSSTAPSVNQVLMWNGSFWTPANVASTSGITAINGLSNTTTSIIGAGNVTVSTSSPNTITITGTGTGAITINGLATSTFQVIGTANQIAVATSGPNNVTLSLPQNISTTSTPTFGALTVNGNATTTGNLTILGFLSDAGGNKYVTSTLGAATTTINGINGPLFTIASTTYLGVATSGTTLTLTNLGVTTTTGNWLGTWQGVNSTTFYSASNPNSYISSSTGNGLYYPLSSNPAGYLTSASSGVTTTVNGITSSTFNFLAGGTGLTVASSANPNNITYTWTNPGYALLSGNSTWAGAQTFNATSTYIGPIIVQTNQALSIAGQVAVKTTSSTFNFNDGTAERVLDPVQCTSPFIIQNVTSSPVSDEVVWSPYVTSTIVLFRSVNLSTGDTMTFNIIWGGQRSTASASAQHLFSSNQTSNSITTWDSFAPGTFASTTVPSGSFVRALTTSAASSSEWTSQICYRENP